MADQQQLERLTRSVDEWNKWRREQPDIAPNLSYASLSSTDLSYADFHSTNLDFSDLSSTDFQFANFNGADLRSANLTRAVFWGADLGHADLRSANFTHATLGSADLRYTNLSSANLSSANLIYTNLDAADLDFANLSSASFCYTILARLDLNNVKGLETVTHEGPSIVDINSVILPRDQSTREHFLRGIGFTQTQIEYLPSLLTPWPLQYHSLFISYAHQDEAIAKRLHIDLRKNDVPCWFAPHDLKPGNYFREEIDKAIHMQEKILLILSKHSVESRWVKHEVNRARHREIEQDRQILYPIRLDDTVLKSTNDWVADLRAYRHIGDFTAWQDDAAYHQTFSRLLQDLKVSGSLTL